MSVIGWIKKRIRKALLDGVEIDRTRHGEALDAAQASISRQRLDQRIEDADGFNEDLARNYRAASKRQSRVARDVGRAVGGVLDTFNRRTP